MKGELTRKLNETRGSIEDTPLVDAVQTLHTTKFGALPVLRDGKLVGIVTDTDLLACLSELMSQGG